MKTMVLKASALAGALGLLAAAGCAHYEVVDPPADAFGENDSAVFPDLSLAVVVNDADITWTLKPWLGMAGAHKTLKSEKPDFDALSALVDTLRDNFKKADRVASAAEARSKGYDLIATVAIDVYTEGTTNSYNKYTLTMNFADPKAGPVGTVVAEGKAMIMQEKYISRDGIDGNARARAMKWLVVNLRNSAALQTFAANRRPEPAAAVAAAPAPRVEPVAAPAPAPSAPAAKSYRADAETPAFALPEDEHKFALVVGVEKYAELPPAEHAARDAKAVKAHLLALGYPERNIIYLTDNRALKTGLEKYVESWLPRNVDENSTVFFYFSGHGAPDPVTAQAYLVPWDGDPKFLDTTGYSVKRLYQKLNALKAKKILVAMDSCFSGTGGRSVLARGARPLVAKVDAGAGVVGRVAALTASAEDEMSGIDEASGHGLFTYQLIRAMNARQGKATMKDLFDFLSPKVRDAARRDNRDQTPQLIGNGAASL